MLHISVGPKIKILESRSYFRDFFSKKTWSFLKSSNFDLEKIAPSSHKPKRPETRVGLVRVKVDENYGRSGKPFFESMRR